MFNCESWQQWLRQYLAIVLPVISKSKKSFFDFNINQDDSYQVNCMFFDMFIINDSINSQQDFISLRSLPLIKLKEGRYRVINELFLIEKMFKSIQFLFSLKINSELPEKGNRRKDFRGEYCDNFSEQEVMYQSIKNSFPTKWIHKPGIEFQRKEYKGSPDYFLRFKNKIFLFESKDVFLTGDVKQSRNYKTLSKALKEKFYKIENSDGKLEEKKAILQLIENIKRIKTKYYEKIDMDYNEDVVRIYPILVTHDRQFDCLGVNKLLQKWFIEELKLIKNDIDIRNVFPLTVMNIDVLILYQEAFKNRSKIRLENLIEDYHKYTFVLTKNYKSKSELEQKINNSLISFSVFVEQEIEKAGVKKFPSIVFDYAKQLFEESQNSLSGR
jgi:hypothetical protein